MTFVAKPRTHHPKLPLNEIGLTRRDYEGSVSTLCAGCGHDSVSAAIVQACAELSLPPHRFAKVSGIGCSSKTPSYFLNKSHGLNSVHGRMPSVITGANLANRDLYCIGVSGDGDSASIGLGQFAHIMRRRINMLYIVDNNGTYGLTKGQFSATNDKGSTSKKGVPNLYEPIDLVSMAMQIGASFVARSFSGDKRQLVPLIQAGLRHKGMAFIDVISPCVAFNNHQGSTKSYDHVPGGDYRRLPAGNHGRRAHAGWLDPAPAQDGQRLRPPRPCGGAQLRATPCGRGRNRYRSALCRSKRRGLP